MGVEQGRSVKTAQQLFNLTQADRKLSEEEEKMGNIDQAAIEQALGRLSAARADAPEAVQAAMDGIIARNMGAAEGADAAEVSLHQFDAAQAAERVSGAEGVASAEGVAGAQSRASGAQPRVIFDEANAEYRLLSP